MSFKANAVNKEEVKEGGKEERGLFKANAVNA